MPPRRYQPRRGPRPQRRRDGGPEGGLAVETQPVVPRGGAPVELPSSVSVTDLATALSVSHADVIKELIRNGIFATINQSIDFDTASLVAGELGIETVERGAAQRAAAEAASQQEIVAPGSGSLVLVSTMRPRNMRAAGGAGGGVASAAGCSGAG